MIEALLKIGDRVAITVPKENRDWGYNPCPDGTEATVLGFREIHHGRMAGLGLKPGVYVNRSWARLRLEGGSEHSELTGRLSLVDTREEKRREKKWRASREGRDWLGEKEFIRDLPATPFWEGDTVRAPGRSYLDPKPEADAHAFVVTGIDYPYLDKLTDAGTKWAAYRISEGFGAGWYTSENEDGLELIGRGNVWKYYHGEPLRFAGIKEEADFFFRLGRTEEVRNPATGLYDWTKDEVLQAIREGTVHSLQMGTGLFGSGPYVEAIRFQDEEVGRRVAMATLEGFGLV